MAHVIWLQLKFRMTVIPHGVTKETVAESLESKGMAENKEEWGTRTKEKKTKQCSPVGKQCFKAYTFRELETKRTDTRLDTEGIIQSIIQMESKKGCQEAGRGAQGSTEEEGRMR